MQPRGRGFDHHQRIAQGGLVGAVVAGQFQRAQHPRERRAQFMRQHRDELRLAAADPGFGFGRRAQGRVGFGDPVGHGIQCVPQARDFGRDRGRGRPCGAVVAL